MNPSFEQRIELLDVVTQVEEGDIPPPRVPGEVGAFLRELGGLRAHVSDLVLDGEQFARGREVGSIRLTPLAPLRENMRTELLGETASTIALSEELAGTVNVMLWSKARAANRLRNIWLRDTVGASLRGNFRWYAPRRVTPGTAAVEKLATSTGPWEARCLKFVAEEFLAPPIAASYRWDTAFGDPDFRNVRVAAVYTDSNGRYLLPGARSVRPGAVPLAWPDSGVGAPRALGELLLALLVRDPWSPVWSVVKTKPIDGDDALAHLISWADHIRELRGLPSPTAPEITAMQERLASLGYTANRDEALNRANLARAVGGTVRQIAAWTRGLQ